MLEYLKYSFLPEALQPGFPATPSATGSGDLQPWRPGESDQGWRSGLADRAAGPVVQQRQGGEVHPGRVGGRISPVAGTRGMSQRSSGEGAVLTVRGCRPHQGRVLQGRALHQPSGLGRHGSAPGGRRTLRSAQRTRGLATCALRGEFISVMGRVIPGPYGQNGRPPRSDSSVFNWTDKLLGTHPLSWFTWSNSTVRLARLPNSGGISPLNWFAWRISSAGLVRFSVEQQFPCTRPCSLI